MTQQFLTINDLIARLKTFESDKRVHFDFCNCVPGKIGSYRGYYDRPSIGWLPSGYSWNGFGGENQYYPTVSSLIKELQHSISGVKFEGWKGGEYSYNGSEQLYVDNPGDYTATRIVSVKLIDYSVLLITAKEQSE